MKRSLTVLMLAGVALAGCSEETKKDLGLVNTPPDEFSVVTRAPLSVPPDFTLRPPRPGAQRPMEISTQEVARQTVFGASGASSSTATTGPAEERFLSKIGATQADPNIRDIVDGERAQGAEDSRSTAEKLMFWSDSKPQDQGTPIDPKEELSRLKQEGIVTLEKRTEEAPAP